MTKKKPASPAAGADNVRAVLATIVELTDDFCRIHLSDEYAALCRELAQTLARKRPSPLVRGQPNSWACGIVRTIGLVNFLSDPSRTPHLKTAAIDEGFGVSEATGQAKSMSIRKLLEIGQFEPDWTLPSLVGENPFIWILSVNGFPMDIRHAPLEAQIVAYERGLIPYVPGLEEPGDDEKDRGE